MSLNLAYEGVGLVKYSTGEMKIAVRAFQRLFTDLSRLSLITADILMSDIIVLFQFLANFFLLLRKGDLSLGLLMV